MGKFSTKGKSGGNGGDFPLPDEGLYMATVAAIADCGLMQTSFGEKHKVAIFLALDAEELDNDGVGTGQPWLVRGLYTYTLAPKGNLAPLVGKALGLPLEDVNEETVPELDAILGAVLQVEVVHSKPTTEGRIYANLGAILKPKAGATGPDLSEWEVPEWVAKHYGLENIASVADRPHGADGAPVKPAQEAKPEAPAPAAAKPAARRMFGAKK